RSNQRRDISRTRVQPSPRASADRTIFIGVQLLQRRRAVRADPKADQHFTLYHVATLEGLLFSSAASLRQSVQNVRRNQCNDSETHEGNGTKNVLHSNAVNSCEDARSADSSTSARRSSVSKRSTKSLSANRYRGVTRAENRNVIVASR